MPLQKVINGSLENVDYTNDPNSPWRMRTGTSELPDPNDNESVKDDDGENDTASVRQGQAPHGEAITLHLPFCNPLVWLGLGMHKKIRMMCGWFCAAHVVLG